MACGSRSGPARKKLSGCAGTEPQARFSPHRSRSRGRGEPVACSNGWLSHAGIEPWTFGLMAAILMLAALLAMRFPRAAPAGWIQEHVESRGEGAPTFWRRTWLRIKGGDTDE